MVKYVMTVYFLCFKSRTDYVLVKKGSGVVSWRVVWAMELWAEVRYEFWMLGRGLVCGG